MRLRLTLVEEFISATKTAPCTGVVGLEDELNALVYRDDGLRQLVTTQTRLEVHRVV